ncbi:MAG: HEAT repeat domain-containing protein [Planctomycetales bacterium]
MFRLTNVLAIVGLLVLARITAPFAIAEEETASKSAKPLRLWLADLHSEDPEIRKLAAEAIQQRASETYEVIGWNPRGAPILQRLGGGGLFFSTVLTEPDEEDSLTRLSRLQDEARMLTSELLKLLESPHEECRSSAARILWFIGAEAESACPLLLKIIRTTDGPSRMDAIIALLHVTPVNKTVGPELIEAIAAGGQAKTKPVPQERDDAPDRDLARAGIEGVLCAKLLIESGRTLVELPSVIELTRQKYSKPVRATAILTLLQLGPEANGAVPALKGLLTDDDRGIRQIAGTAVILIVGDRTEAPAIIEAMNLGEGKTTAVDELVGQFFRDQDSTRRYLREGPAEILSSASDTIELSKYAPPALLRHLIRTLGDIGPAAKSVIPDLAKLLESPDAATREAARKAIEQIGG